MSDDNPLAHLFKPPAPGALFSTDRTNRPHVQRVLFPNARRTNLLDSPSIPRPVPVEQRRQPETSNRIIVFRDMADDDDSAASSASDDNTASSADNDEVASSNDNNMASPNDEGTVPFAGDDSTDPSIDDDDAASSTSDDGASALPRRLADISLGDLREYPSPPSDEFSEFIHPLSPVQGHHGYTGTMEPGTLSRPIDFMDWGNTHTPSRHPSARSVRFNDEDGVVDDGHSTNGHETNESSPMTETQTEAELSQMEAAAIPPIDTELTESESSDEESMAPNDSESSDFPSITPGPSLDGSPASTAFLARRPYEEDLYGTGRRRVSPPSSPLSDYGEDYAEDYAEPVEDNIEDAGGETDDDATIVADDFVAGSRSPSPPAPFPRRSAAAGTAPSTSSARMAPMAATASYVPIGSNTMGSENLGLFADYAAARSSYNVRAYAAAAAAAGGVANGNGSFAPGPADRERYYGCGFPSASRPSGYTTAVFRPVPSSSAAAAATHQPPAAPDVGPPQFGGIPGSIWGRSNLSVPGDPFVDAGTAAGHGRLPPSSQPARGKGKRSYDEMAGTTTMTGRDAAHERELARGAGFVFGGGPFHSLAAIGQRRRQGQSGSSYGVRKMAKVDAEGDEEMEDADE
jgi:hypothetical protein